MNSATPSKVLTAINLPYSIHDWSFQMESSPPVAKWTSAALQLKLPRLHKSGMRNFFGQPRKTAPGFMPSSAPGFPKTATGSIQSCQQCLRWISPAKAMATNIIMNSFYRTVSFISSLTHEIIFDLQTNMTACTEGLYCSAGDIFKCSVQTPATWLLHPAYTVYIVNKKHRHGNRPS